MPDAPPPCLATLVDEPPEGDDWLHEIKFDGYRLLARVDHGTVRLLSRGGKDWTSRLPEIASSAAALPAEAALLDGEVVAVAPDGTTRFEALQEALGTAPAGRASLRYYAFDLLHLDGWNLEGVELVRRKSMLERLVGTTGGTVLYASHVRGDGRKFLEAACRHHLEGIVSKRAASGYQHRRTLDWRKVRCGERQEFVIVGYVPHAVDPDAVGSLLLAVHEDGRLVYAGRVGTGFDDSTRRRLRARLESIARPDSPLHAPVSDVAALPHVRWTKPLLVGEVSFTEWTRAGRLRHPSFVGLREDKAPRDVVRERRSPPSVRAGDGRASPRAGARARRIAARPPPPPPARTVPSVRITRGASMLTHPGRVLWPESNVTKQMLATYYAEVADRMLPYVADRPLMLLRCPEGRTAECFYQKHLEPGTSTAIRPVEITEKGAARPYPTIRDAKGLEALVQIGTLEIHGWGARSDAIERPDRVVFDLDPAPEVPFPQVVAAALRLRDRLASWGLRSFAMTSGGKGLHVHVPLGRFHTWDVARTFARDVAVRFERGFPAQFVSSASKDRRAGKIYIDWLRNGRGATAVSPYSTRAREGAPVATPLAWEEVSPRLSPGAFTMDVVRARVARADPWRAYAGTRQRLTRAIERLRGDDEPSERPSGRG